MPPSDSSIPDPELPGAVLAPEPEINPKFFFIHPPAWVQVEMIPALIRSEVPSYITPSLSSIPRIAEKYPGSVLYINAERSGTERADWVKIFEEWQTLLREHKMTVVFLDRGITPSRQSEIRKPGIPTAFIELNQSPRVIFNLVYTMAVKLNEKSRRKAIRVGCELLGLTPSWNVQVSGTKIRGEIRDISSSGMAAYFPPDALAYIVEGNELRNVQLQLKGSPILVNANIVALRENDDKKLMIALFRWGDDKRSKEHIHEYIFIRLQDELNQLLA